MHSHAERGNEKNQGSRSHALRGNACSDALRRVFNIQQTREEL